MSVHCGGSLEFHPLKLFLVADGSEDQLQTKASVNEVVEQVDKRVTSHHTVFMQDFRRNLRRKELNY